MDILKSHINEYENNIPGELQDLLKAQSLFGVHVWLTVAAHDAQRTRIEEQGDRGGVIDGRWVERSAARSPLAGAVDEATVTCAPAEVVGGWDGRQQVLGGGRGGQGRRWLCEEDEQCMGVGVCASSAASARALGRALYLMS